MKEKVITKTVLLLGLVSLFTDMASEMLYPIMPAYLESIGFSVLGIGILEGIAQATAGFSKGFFGQWSDNASRRLPFVQLGYGLSAISKPLMTVWINPWWIFFVRTSDRIGKGIRSSARDAMLSEESTSNTKGEIFGFHRSMDTLGAAIGPIIALIFLWIYPKSYKALFIIAFIPGLISIISTLLIKEKPKNINALKIRPNFFNFLKYIKTSSKTYKRLLTGVILFTLFNSSDLFLLLVLKYKGVSDSGVIGFYIFYNLVFALTAYPIGKLSDKIGQKSLFIIGIILFSIAYLGISFTKDFWILSLIFLIYGLYASCTEGIVKAWISNISRVEERGTAIGTFDSISSIALLISSSIAGIIWYSFGSTMMFLSTGIAVFVVAVYLVFFVPNN